MHSSFRKELRSTSKLLQSVRSRPQSPSPASRRKFASHPRLLNKPGTESNDASSINEKDSTSTDQNVSPSSAEDPTSSSDPKTLETLSRMIHEASDISGLSQKWSRIREESAKEGRTIPRLREILEDVLKEGDSGVRSVAREGDEGSTRPSNGSKLTIDPPPSKSHRMPHSNEEDDKTPAQDNLSASSSMITTKTEETNVPSPDNGQTPEHDFALGGHPPPPDFEHPSTSKYHGSAAARRQRERHARSREKPPAFVLPEWFNERGVLTWGDGQLNPNVTSRIGVIGNADSPSLGSDVKPWGKSSVLPPSKPYINPAGLRSTPLLDSMLFGYRFPPTPPLPLLTPPHMRQSNTNPLATHALQDQADTAKKQTFAPGGAEPSRSGTDDPSATPGSDATSRTTPTEFVAVNNEYYLHAAQLTELSMTIQGRLRLPASGSLQNKPGGIKSHVTVHYTASDGDLFLHHLMIDIARTLQCNLIQIDAQDIAALIAKADIDPMLIDEAKTLSYEVFGEVYQEESNEEAFMPPSWPDDMEDADEDNSQGPKGVPFMVGKPITIDLKALFGSKGPRKGNSPFFQKNMMPDMFGRPQMGKSSPHIFSSIIDSILSSLQHTRRLSNQETSEQKDANRSEEKPQNKHLPKDATIVHIKDLKAIQETNIGKHFLSQLYDQVDRRRGHGDGIMIVGTECARESNSFYDTERIRNMQVSEPDENFSTVVLTPVLPGLNGKDKYSSSGQFRNESIAKRDRAKHLQMINARHLYEMLQSKNITIEPLREGFWAKEFTQELTKDDQDCLAKGFWSFSYVQRLAAIMASSAASSDFKTASDSPVSVAVSILEESDALKTRWVKETQPQKSKPNRKDKNTEEPENDKLAAIRSKATKHEKKLLGGVIESNKISTTFKDIHIPAETVDALQTLTTLSLVRPDAFKYGVLASDRIPGLLLYGPPGTGKTLAAKAVAKESGATVLEVSAADINDMYVGEGEKNVKALFSLAKKLAPCIVFLDEADAMFSSRSHAGRRVSHRELLNQFLKEWDGMSNDSGSAFIMVATNRPMDLDDAVLRRLPRRLLIDLPTEKDRAEILKIHLSGEEVSEEVSVKDLAARTPFYSGSDLKNVVVAAALNCVREENERAKQHTGEEPFQYQSKRILNASHFERALGEIGSSISEDMASLRDIKKFDEQYGDKKGRKRRSPKWGFKTTAEADAVLDTVKVRSS